MKEIENKNSQYWTGLVKANAFATGFIIMAFEMVVSRYMYPYFGSGISTWAALISVAMIALMAGYSIGGNLADKKGCPITLSNFLIIAGIFIGLTPLFYEASFNFIINNIDGDEIGSLIAAFIVLFIPILFLASFTPYSIKFLLHNTSISGKVSGSLYSISTFGNIVGTLFVTYFMIPYMGSNNIVFILALITIASGFSFRINLQNKTTKNND